MTFHQRLALIGVMVALGMVRVWMRTGVRLKAYEIGRMEAQRHRLENETMWMKAQLIERQSPMRLAGVMQNRHPEFVAWAAWSPHLTHGPSDHAKRVASATPDAD